MLINRNTALHTNRVVLVPYCEHHVQKYHKWMKDPDLQAATASEPLCLAEEYRMQQCWQTDSDKLTFISCVPHESHVSQGEIDAMLGDVNLFVLINEEEDGSLALVGEIELMIAKRENQKRGYGRAALLTFLKYVLQHQSEILEQYFVSPRALPATGEFAYYRVKINESNVRSITLFESLGFNKTEISPNFFDEFELRKRDLNLEMVERSMRERGIKDYNESAYRQSPTHSPVLSGSQGTDSVSNDSIEG